MIALARDDARAHALLLRARNRHDHIVIPAVVVAETVRASNATVDALVVADAVCRGGGTVLTGDADDLDQLAATHPEVVIRHL